MCGIAGVFASSHHSGRLSDYASAMANALFHRGPDDSGVWVDEPLGLALAHQRLSILDLSPAGHQPMMSAAGRFIAGFNGEIYNHAQLRTEIDRAGIGPRWRGHSDTEVMLAAIAAWGVGTALEKFVGMFAFALWDRESRSLTLARDRMGEKPLYYGLHRGALLFGSELKAVRSCPWFSGEIDRDALALLLKHGYVSSPYSIYKGIRKLPPGTFLTVTRRDVESGALPDPISYWSAAKVAEDGVADPLQDDETEAINKLDQLMRQVVSGQMVADVPLGAFLSGGIDSSTVAALMQAQSSRPVRTFSIGFHEPGYNEAQHARAVARHLGTDHTEFYVTPHDALEVVPKLPEVYDEPFADSSQIPTCLLCHLAKRHVTVSLSGDGGDELFGGYNRYFVATRLWRAMDWMPHALRVSIARWIKARSPTDWDSAVQRVPWLVPSSLYYSAVGDKLHKLADLLPLSGPADVYRALVSFWRQTADVVIGAAELPTPIAEGDAADDWTVPAHRMMYLDQVSYLPDGILVKVDRASMAMSLETRIPYLDHRIVEFAWRLPLSMKIRRGRGKWLLRQVLHQYVPKRLVDRPKMGFSVPIAVWLRGPLREWAEALLDEARLMREGYFLPTPIRQKWIEHLSGRRNWSSHLWNVLMFQAWLESQRSAQRAAYCEGIVGS